LSSRTHDSPAARSQVERIELAPNSSLSPRDAALFFGTLGFVTLAIAVFFVAQGYWPVLPFAGLELVVLFWALAASMRRRHCRERILVSDDEVAIETQFRGELTRVVFSRHWARIRLRAPFTRCIRAASRSNRTAGASRSAAF